MLTVTHAFSSSLEYSSLKYSSPEYSSPDSSLLDSSSLTEVVIGTQERLEAVADWTSLRGCLALFAMDEDSAGSPGEEAPAPDEGETGLDDAVRGEREYVRRRLREELKREPSEEDIDEWLQQHTEGY